MPQSNIGCFWMLLRYIQAWMLKSCKWMDGIRPLNAPMLWAPLGGGNNASKYSKDVVIVFPNIFLLICWCVPIFGKKSGPSWDTARKVAEVGNKCLLQQQYVQSLFTNIQIHKQIGQFESREAIWKKYKMPITGNSSSCAAVTFSKLKSQPLSKKHIGSTSHSEKKSDQTWTKCPLNTHSISFACKYQQLLSFPFKDVFSGSRRI